MKITRQSKNSNGFTLIELLVVISIIGLLSSIVLSSLSTARMKTRNTRRISDIETIAQGFQIATTGSTNKLPGTSGQGYCLGKTPCWGGMFSDITGPGVNNLLKTGIAGKVIPFDPLWKTGPGDAYIYDSYLLLGDGVVLIWLMENDPGAPESSMSCGRGFFTGVMTPITYSCVLTLGPQNS